jgi:hypothetical protein
MSERLSTMEKAILEILARTRGISSNKSGKALLHGYSSSTRRCSQNSNLNGSRADSVSSNGIGATIHEERSQRRALGGAGERGQHRLLRLRFVDPQQAGLRSPYPQPPFRIHQQASDSFGRARRQRARRARPRRPSRCPTRRPCRSRRARSMTSTT